VGASGGILALANVLPDACVRLFDLVQAGRHEEALVLQRLLMPLAQLLGSTHGVPGLKAALGMRGCDVGVPRLPLLPLEEPVLTSIREALVAFDEGSRHLFSSEGALEEFSA
jgi:dihydrodipicolinate synthase/N-acetylneuraminate lyase